MEKNTSLHGVTIQNTATYIVVAGKLQTSYQEEKTCVILQYTYPAPVEIFQARNPAPSETVTVELG
jgi:hypothetical protein